MLKTVNRKKQSHILSIYQKVVGDGPHAFVRQNDPDNYDVSDHGHRYDGAVGDGPKRHLPGGLDEAVGVAAEVNRRDGCSVLGGRSGGVVGRLHLLCVGPCARDGVCQKIDRGVALLEGDSRRGGQRGRMRPRGPERSAA